MENPPTPEPEHPREGPFSSRRNFLLRSGLFAGLMTLLPDVLDEDETREERKKEPWTGMNKATRTTGVTNFLLKGLGEVGRITGALTQPATDRIYEYENGGQVHVMSVKASEEGWKQNRRELEDAIAPADMLFLPTSDPKDTSDEERKFYGKVMKSAQSGKTHINHTGSPDPELRWVSILATLTSLVVSGRMVVWKIVNPTQGVAGMVAIPLFGMTGSAAPYPRSLNLSYPDSTNVKTVVAADECAEGQGAKVLILADAARAREMDAYMRNPWLAKTKEKIYRQTYWKLENTQS